MLNLIIRLTQKLLENMFFFGGLILIFTYLKPYIQFVIYHINVGPRILFSAFISPSAFNWIFYLVGLIISFILVKKIISKF